jgi:hypothetical protein
MVHRILFSDHIVAACGETYHKRIAEGMKTSSEETGLLNVRPGKVVNFCGREPRTGKAGQPPVREHWAGGGNRKGQAQWDRDSRP